MADSTIAIKITGNTADITNKLKQVNANLNAMGSRATVAKGKMAGLGNSFTGVMGKASALSAGFLGIAAAIRAISGTVKTLANFDFEMSKVEAISGATGKTLSEMTDLARKMGATTMYTATEAASAMKFLSMAGFDAKQSMAALPATLDLAQAGTIDLGRAADITSNIMAAYGIETERTNGVVDDMVSIVNNANTNVQQLGDAMKYVGAAAAASGVDIPTTAAAIGVLSNAGMQGAMAGTGLRQVFIRLTNVTGSAEDALSGMGLTLDQVNPQMVGLTQAITRLREAGMSGAEAITIFGARGAVAALNLAKGLPKYHELKDLMEDNEGIANKTAKTMQNNLMGAFKLLKSAVQEAVLAFGDKGFAGSLEGFVRTMTEMIRIMTGSGDALSEFHDRAQRMKIVVDRIIEVGKIFFLVWGVSKIMSIVTAIGVFTKGLVKLGAVIIGKVITALTAMRAALGALTTAFLATGIGAVVVTLGLLVTHLVSMGDEADAAARTYERLNAQVKEFAKNKTSLKPVEGEGEGGGDKKGILDTGDLKDFKDYESEADISEQSNLAKLIKERAIDAQIALTSVGRQMADAEGKISGDTFDEFIANADNLKQVEEAMARVGIEGEVSLDKFNQAQKISIAEAKKAAVVIGKLGMSSYRSQIIANIAAKKHNELVRERLAIMQKLGEAAARGADEETSQSGKVGIISGRLGKTKDEMRPLEDKESLTAEEQERLTFLREHESILEQQLTVERRLLEAQRAGSKALEEQIELQKLINEAERERERIAKDIADNKVDEDLMSDTTAIDAISALDELKKLSDEAKNMDADLLHLGEGAGSTDLYGKFEKAQDIVGRFGEGGDLSGVTSPDAKAEVEELQKQMQDQMQRMFDAGFVQEHGYSGRGLESKGDVGEEELIKSLENVGDRMEDQMRKNAIRSVQEYARSFINSLGDNQGELRKNAETLLQQITSPDAFDPEQAREFIEKLRTLQDSLKNQQIVAEGKHNGLLEEKEKLMDRIVSKRMKEVREINKVLTADNKSVDMRKRQLKLMGQKVGGQGARDELREMEGAEQIADHMEGYEDALRKRMSYQEMDRMGKPAGEGDLTNDKINQLMDEERRIAANVIAQEMAAKAAQGGTGFGVSSLAKIGGGGGVGAGGATLLDVAELTNKLLERAEVQRNKNLEKVNKTVNAIEAQTQYFKQRFGDAPEGGGDVSFFGI